MDWICNGCSTPAHRSGIGRQTGKSVKYLTIFDGSLVKFLTTVLRFWCVELKFDGPLKTGNGTQDHHRLRRFDTSQCEALYCGNVPFSRNGHDARRPVFRYA
jgi:hypothetical protein